MRPSERTTPTLTIAAYVLVVVAIIGTAILLLLRRPQPVQIEIQPPVPTDTPPPTATPEPYTIYVTGAVAQPGSVLLLPWDSRVQDAINAAGGALPNADMTRVNLADTLRDGDQVHVPAVGELPGSAGAGVVDSNADTAEQLGLATPSGGNLININTASVAELETLPGIGPAIAGRIVAFREENGPFSDAESLTAVSGIGPSTVEEIAGLVSFGVP